MNVQEVAPGAVVTTSRRDATTSTIVASGDEALLIDPAWDPDELERIADLVAERGLRVVAGIATHAHHDHVLWHPRFGDVPRYASRRTTELAEQHRDDLIANLGAAWPAALADLVGRVQAADVVPWTEPVELVVHDGHAPGHTAVWLPERGVLFAGDMLSDVELPLPFDPDDLSAYLVGLDTLAPYVARARVLVPGHGTPTDAPAARLAADRRYLDAVLAGHDPDDPRRGNPGMAEVHDRVRRLGGRMGA